MPSVASWVPASSALGLAHLECNLSWAEPTGNLSWAKSKGGFASAFPSVELAKAAPVWILARWN